jgi:D-3-phosphoglycerate dehydrogenase
MGGSLPPGRPGLLVAGAYPAWDMEPLEAAYDVTRLWDVADRASFLGAPNPGLRALATRGDIGADATLIAALPDLEIIACYGVGTDAIDLVAARARGIRVTNTPDVLTGDVADLAVGLTLALLRGIPAADLHVRSGAWATRPMSLLARVHGRRIGIAGFGRIGQAVARRFEGFDAAVGYFARTPREDSAHRFFPGLQALADWADVLVVTMAGGAATANLIGTDVLGALGPQGYLVNVARGSVVDEPALLEALEHRRIAGAALDVFWNEPRIDTRFLALPNVILQPHHASATVETRRAMGALVRENLAAHFAGRPLPSPVL